MKTGREGIDLIKAFEGCRLTAYRDPIGVLTIGFGHTAMAGPPKPVAGMKVTAQHAEDILITDLGKYEFGVSKVLTRSPNQHQFDAMVSLCFNIGPTNFAKSSVVRYFNAGSVTKAADRFLAWNKAGGKVLKGLTRRRAAERALFLTPMPAVIEFPIGVRVEDIPPPDVEPPEAPPRVATRITEGNTLMNMNSFRTIMTVVAGLLVSVMTFAPQFLGCTIEAVTNAVDCSASWLPPVWAGLVATGLMVLNLILKALQGGGFGPGLVNKTVVVSPTGAPGTVTNAQVEAGPKKGS